MVNQTYIYDVVINLKVDKKGDPFDVSSNKGNLFLRTAVVKAVRKWKFRSLKKDGKNICFKDSLTFSYD
jgi:outer membrane biosynthesis protein TonB